MKILKKILFVILGIVAVLLIIALFIPKDYTVSVSTNINKPQQEVFDYVKMIENQKNYSIWVMEDPNAKMEYKGTDGTVGFISAWDSQNKNVGKGEQQITNVIEGERIDVDLRFERPFKGEAKAATIVKAVSENESQVINEFYGHSPYPMNLMSVMAKGMLKDAMSTNMNNLKNILEKQ